MICHSRKKEHNISRSMPNIEQNSQYIAYAGITFEHKFLGTNNGNFNNGISGHSEFSRDHEVRVYFLAVPIVVLFTLNVDI